MNAPKVITPAHKPKPGPKPKQEVVVHQPQPAERPPVNFLELMFRMSIDPRVDVAKMQAAMTAGQDLQERLEDRESKKAFTVAFSALQADLPVITKDKMIDHGEGTTMRGNKKLKATYSSYPNLMRVCRPLLKAHGFTFNNTTEPTADGTRIAVVGYLTHVGGHGMKTSFPLGADAGPGRSNAQAWGSASSYGKRYNLVLLLDIISEAPEDQDDDARKTAKARVVEVDANDPISTGTGNDGNGGFPGDKVLVTAEQAEQIQNAIQFCGVPMKTFTAKFKVENVADLPRYEFKNALTSCENYRKAKDGQK